MDVKKEQKGRPELFFPFLKNPTHSIKTSKEQAMRIWIKSSSNQKLEPKFEFGPNNKMVCLLATHLTPL